MTYQEADLLDQLQDVDAHAFEEFIADLWERQHWSTHVTPESADGGVDIIAEQSTPVPQKQAIQVKRYRESNRVGRPEIQQYASVREERTDVDSVVVVTTSRFTDSATELATQLNVKLIDGARLHNLIDALDAVELAESYIDPTTERPQAPGADGETSPPTQPPASQSTSDPPESIVEFDQEIEPNEVPRVLPEVIALRQEITAAVDDIQSPLNRAERAFDQGRYFDAVTEYGDVNEQRIDLNRKIARYDAGLANIGSNTGARLPSSDKYASQLENLLAGVTDQYREAFRIAERAKSLDLLHAELTEQIETVENRINQGDELRNSGDVEAAKPVYKRANTALETARETKELYDGLVSEYDEEVIQAHSGTPADVSLDSLATAIEERIEIQDEYVDRVSIAAAAAGSFDAGILTDNSGELFEQDLIEYLDDGEQPEYIFKPPRLGFSIVAAGGESATTPHDAMDAGSCFLVISDQRVLYVAGVEDHDETVDIDFADLASVDASRDGGTASLTFELASGETYLFDGLRDNVEDLAAAADFLNSRS